MTDKEIFIGAVDIAFKALENADIAIDQRAKDYLEQLKATPEKEKAPFTENGAKILTWMQENYIKYNNTLKSKDIAEGLFCSSRTVSGAIRKLVTDGYVEKVGTNPVCYSLTEVGKVCEVIAPAPKEVTD